MRTILKTIMIASFLILIVSNPVYSGYKKLAQSGFKFLSVATDARASALSGALTSMEGKSTSLFFNPASMSRMNYEFDLSLGQVGWIADIKYLYGSMAYRPMGGSIGVFGISFLSVDYGTMQSTILANNDQGYLDVGEFAPYAYVVGLGYAKALTNKFSVGGQIKYAFQDLGGGVVRFQSNETQYTEKFNVGVVAFDFGILYRTGFKSLIFGMNIRNFSKEIEYIKESFQLPLNFEMGISMNVLDLYEISPEVHKLFLSVDATHPRDYPEQLDIGMEYVFRNTFALRMGYTTPTDEQGMSFGVGLKPTISKMNVAIDYAYTPFGIFNDVHRISFNISF
ncbi:MAG: PorV/PorQ family protein [Calditrichaeota bacterium]|nr:PorV/PorQ family protein [Calditrichota bacterium]